MSAHNPVVRPFLKWAGGKRQLLPEIKKLLPKRMGHYVEPFVGGGAVFLELQRPKIIINDKNKELINCYEVVKESIEDLIECLQTYKERNNEKYFYEIREMDRAADFSQKPRVERAARLIYLNKTCYNGLFRVNSQGQFNVPFGRYKNPNILDHAVLKAVSKYLNTVDCQILNQDFAEAVASAQAEDFIYFDPPYDPMSQTASFTGYDMNGFDKSQQERLKACADALVDRGCHVLLSNSATPFIEQLYGDRDKYRQFKVKATRQINSNADKRGAIEEILIASHYA